MTVTGVLNPDTPLPVIVRDVNGKVICRTLGEAFQKGVSIWWPEGDLEVTYDAGCSIGNSIKLFANETTLSVIGRIHRGTSRGGRCCPFALNQFSEIDVFSSRFVVDYNNIFCRK